MELAPSMMAGSLGLISQPSCTRWDRRSAGGYQAKNDPTADANRWIDPKAWDARIVTHQEKNTFTTKH